MPEQEQNPVDYHVLGKYLAGDATPEEAITVDEWLHEPVFKKQFDEIEKIWNGLPGDTQHHLPDRLAAWAELQPLLHTARPATTVRLFSKWYTIAASVVIVVGAILFFTQNRGNAQDLITRGPYQKIVRDSLPDGTKFVLKQNSVLQYNEAFNTAGRYVQLQGESYFNVTHNKEKPFVITVGDVKIKVLGTAFNIKQTANPETVEVQVKTGLVKMYNDKKELAIKAGQTGIYFKDRDSLVLKDKTGINAFSYATCEFEFESLSMRELIPSLEDAYGVTIVTKNEKILNCTMTGRFNETNFKQIIEMISVTLRFTYTNNGNTYYLEGEGCE